MERRDGVFKEEATDSLRMKTEFLDECLELSSLSNMNHKHGAVVILNGDIVGRGYNYWETFHNSISVHSEAAAIMDARKRINRKDFKKAWMLVVRADKKGTLKMSKPCVKCRKICEAYKLSRILYST